MNSNNNSSRWWKIDFHVHTPISTDFANKKPEEKSISPEDYIKAVVNARLDAVVLTDHNHCGWIEKIRAAQEKILSNRSAYPWYHDVVFFPGFEITINSGTGRIHVLAVFDPGTTQDSVLATLGVCGICENHGDAEKSFTSRNCGDRPRESLIFQCFLDVGPVDTPCLGILCRFPARWRPLNEPTGRGAIVK